MRINTRFPMAVHMLALIELYKSQPSTSELMALSIGTNPVVVRQLMSSLKQAGLIKTQNGVPGCHLAKPAEEITLLEIYHAVQKKSDAPLFDFHPNPNPQCPIGRNIREAMNAPLLDARTAMEQALAGHTLREVADFISRRSTQMDPDHTVILACNSLLLHVQAAQEKMHTHFPVMELDRRLHAEPDQMRSRIFDALNTLPASCETVLVAMGYCGGSWNHISSSRRIVIPKVDDCVTLLLHTDDTPHGNLKEPGHMYLRDCDTGSQSIADMKEEICQTYGMEFGTSIFGSWFQNYTNVDIIDTGVYDCYSEEYVVEAQKNADLIRCSLGYVEGSNHVLEKLVSGQWDAQFVVLEPSREITEQDFGLNDAAVTALRF